MQILKFNLVEILIAVFIIAIGVTGVMGLMPVGLNSARDSRAENYASFAANQFIAWFKRQADNNWSSYVSSIPITHSAIAENDAPTQISGTNIYWKTSEPQFYVIRQKSGTSDSIKDFEAAVRIWRENPLNVGFVTPSGQTKLASLDVTKAARICVEISWPLVKTHTAREKKYFIVDLYKP